MISPSPLFSVVVPLYNKQAYVRRSVDSVLAQTFRDFELIVVDDGSTDGSAGIVRAYKDPRIRLLEQPNSGVSVARNRGIAEASGAWIAFLDADDEWLPGFLEKVRKCAERFPQAGAIYSKVNHIKAGRKLDLFNSVAHEPIVVDYLSVTTFERGQPMVCSATAIRRDVFQRAGTFPVGVKIGEDTDMWLRLAWTTEIAYMPVSLVNYHWDASESHWENFLDWEVRVYTYHKWLADKKIPSHLLKSSRAAHEKYVLKRCARLAFVGKKGAAFGGLLKEMPFRSMLMTECFRALLWICLPKWLITLMKNAKRVIWSRL